MTLTTTQQLVAETIRKFAHDRVAPGAAERDRTGNFPYDLVGELAALGIYGMIFPEQDGGGGADTVSFVLAVEEIAAVDQSVAALVCNQVGLSALPIVTFGTPEQKSRYLPPLFDGSILGAFALTERSGGSDPSSMRTMARRDGDDWVINGGKTFITNAGTDLTDFVIVAARTGDRVDGRAPTGAFIVPTSTPGFQVGPAMRKLGWRSSDTREIGLVDCRVPGDALLGDPERGLSRMLHTLDFGRIQIASLGVAVVQASLAAAVEHARTREAFGRTIADFQGVGFRIADMQADLHASQALTLRAARLRDQGADFSEAAAVAKLYASEAAVRCSDACVQIHGGAGFMDNSVAARLYRDARILPIGEGTSEIQRYILSRSAVRRKDVLTFTDLA
jgi:short-chain 2-methylacyl-CoA dehydrogenase